MNKEKPILFSTPMVQAILEGRKTQTRRIIKLPETMYPMSEKSFYYLSVDKMYTIDNGNGLFMDKIKSKYEIGDILWIRETWQKIEGNRFIYKADNIIWGGKWKPSIFMPREAARIFLKVTNIRVEKLQDISTNDAVAEGIQNYTKSLANTGKYNPDSKLLAYPVTAFSRLWTKINGKDSWVKNPYVWVYEFEKINK